MVNKFIKLAQSQVGYKETGSNNTKYAKYFDTEAWQWFNTKKQGASWCAIFICWLVCQLIGPSKARTFLGCPAPKDNCAAGVPYLWRYLDSKGYKVASKNGKPGDIIFFNGKKHVGLIEKVEDGKYHTIEGNKSNAVKRGSYKIGSSSISGLMRLPWPVESIQEPVTTTPVKRYYTVVKGDTMTKIARKLHVSLAYLKRMNKQIKNINLIYPGQKIYY